MPASLLVQSLDPGPLKQLPEGLEGEQRGQQAFNPGLRCGSSIPAGAELEQEAPQSYGQALIGVLPPGWVSAGSLCCLPGSPQPQHSQRVLEQPSQHDDQRGEEETHQAQPAQLLELHHRLQQPLISSAPDGNNRTVSGEQISCFQPASGSKQTVALINGEFTHYNWGISPEREDTVVITTRTNFLILGQNKNVY